MKYLEIVIHTNREGLEHVQAALISLGITDMVINDPSDLADILKKEKGYEWDYIDDGVLGLANSEPTVTVYFDGDECGDGYRRAESLDIAIDAIRQELMDGVYGEGADFGPLTVTTSLRDDSEWKDNWKEFFKPARVSERIIVKPTWEKYELDEKEKKAGVRILEIDPGMAFGTGTHETTYLCIRALEEYMKRGDSVLDVGCGSGILSIAAALLGAGDCTGIEIDPVAVEVSKKNIQLNGVENIARAQYGDLTEGLEYKADIVVANLMADLVITLCGNVRRNMKQGAKFISSGIIEEKLVEVVDAMRLKGFKIDEVKQDGMWRAVIASL